MNYNQNSYISNIRDKVRICLSYIDPNLSRDDWIRVASAIHHELGPEGFHTFDEWSQPGLSYNARGTKSAWKSISHSKKGCTLGTLIFFARQNGLNPSDLKDSLSIDDDPTRKEFYEQQRQRHLKEMAEQKVKNEQIDQKNKEKAIELAKFRWKNSVPITGINSHPYLLKKKIFNSQVARIYKGFLQIPAFNKKGELTTVQSINANGVKNIIKNSTLGGSSLSLGGNAQNKCFPIILCEGWATGESIQAATRKMYPEIGGLQVVIAFNSGNFNPVAVNIREKYPDRFIIICADDDTLQNKLNVGLTKAHKVQDHVNNVMVTSPNFTEEDIKKFHTEFGKYPSDFNDIYVLKGFSPIMNSIRNELDNINEISKKNDISYETCDGCGF